MVTLRNLRALGCRWDPHSPQLAAAARSAQLTSGCAAVVLWLEEQGLDLESVERAARKRAKKRAAAMAAARARETAAAAKAATEAGACGGAGQGWLASWWKSVRERIRARRWQKHPQCGGVVVV